MMRPPAPRPCASCPYRRDVPSGVWAPEEYEKLRGYDKPTGEQPAGVFQCHQTDREDRARVCAGWAGCHANNPRGHELLALRLAIPFGTMTPADADATADYSTDVELFASGDAAADHGLAEVDAPGVDATDVIDKIRRVRPGVKLREKS